MNGTAYGRIAGHGLTVIRTEHDFVAYAAFCSCNGWSASSRFRALVEQAYAQHRVDAQRDPEGKHDAIRGQLRVLRGFLAPSTDGDPQVPA